MICPICLRSTCPMFLRLNHATIPDAEKTKFFELYHRDVCPTCRRLTLTCAVKGNCVEKEFDKKGLPTWWKPRRRRKAVKQ